MTAPVTINVALPSLTPPLLATIFWEMDDKQQANFFEHLGSLALTTPTPYSREIGSMAGLDIQMYNAGRQCGPLGRDVMSRFSDNGFALLRPKRGEVSADEQMVTAFVEDRWRDVVKEFVDNTIVPEPNCSCHISAPCSDCVDYGAIRELLARANALLARK